MDGMSHRVVTMGTPVSVDLCYDRWQLLQAENEYNKASLLSTTLGEYNQVLDHIPTEKPIKHLLRGNRNAWVDSRTG